MRVSVDQEKFVGRHWTAWYGGAGAASVAAADLSTIKLDHPAASAYVFRFRSSVPPAGSNLAMIGYPLGNRLSLNQGPIIWHGRRSGAPLLAVRMLGAEGASGSPFIDDEGRVVGILQLGLGSTDVLGQRTAGVLEGLDMVRWWGPRARPDLCHAYPKGGIAGCPNTAPPPPPPSPPPSATMYRVRVTVSGGGSVASGPAGIDCPTVCTHSFAAGKTVTFYETPTAGYVFTGWGGLAAWCGMDASCEWTSLAGDVAATATFALAATPPPPPSVSYHVHNCWAQYTGGTSSAVNPASSTASFQASDILARGAQNFWEILDFDQAPATDIPGVTLTLIEPNGKTSNTDTFTFTAGPNLSEVQTAFDWTWSSDSSLFFQHPELSGHGGWQVRWKFPDGETCTTVITVA